LGIKNMTSCIVGAVSQYSLLNTRLWLTCIRVLYTAYKTIGEGAMATWLFVMSLQAHVLGMGKRKKGKEQQISPL
jgi:hypothetical protein